MFGTQSEAEKDVDEDDDEEDDESPDNLVEGDGFGDDAEKEDIE